ncbi:MAG: hypothetical protein PHT19_08895 [Methylococcus sp.]|nr:hypothetical protein [Methylococcus sp.]
MTEKQTIVNTSHDIAVQFLHRVVPDVAERDAVLWGGYWKPDARHPAGGYMWGAAFGSPSALVAWSFKQDADGYETYYALAGFGDQRNDKGRLRRTQSNVIALRSLWADIDVKPNVPGCYPDIGAAVNGLKGFLAMAQMPKPVIVGSGRGLHLYWPLDADTHPNDWRPVAEALKAAMTAAGFLFDPTRTADSASILRLPGTHNRKREPLPVTLAHWDVRPRSLEWYAERLIAWKPKLKATRSTWTRPTDAGETLEKLLDAAPFVPCDDYSGFVKAMTACSAIRPMIGDEAAVELAERIAQNAPDDARERNGDPRYAPATLALKPVTMPPEAGIGTLMGLARDAALALVEGEIGLEALTERGRAAARYLAAHHRGTLKAARAQWEVLA